MDTSQFVHDIRTVVSSGYHIANQEVSVGATVGTALVPRDGNNQDQILNPVDMTLYKAESAGMPQCIFDPGLASAALNSIGIEKVLLSE
ncbi:MAG: hypothetical protein GY761_08360 [Hyphomicrobiales bacterium]|nr:hypothetical protein [Hyphomicrobiales bacterium]